MPTTTTRLTAWASTEGDPEMLVIRQEVENAGTRDEHVVSWGEPLARKPLTLHADGAFADDLDAVVESMGFRTTGTWETTDDGGVTTVERV